MKRKPAGRVRICHDAGWRDVPFVMGGSITLADTEYLYLLVASRPLMVKRAGLPLWMQYSVGATEFQPGELVGGRLDFRRLP